MARPISNHVKEVRALLEQRLQDGLHRPGDRFLSNRAIAAQYGISYQTAQRLLTELVDAGMLERRQGSGSFLPGGEARLRAVEILFHSRARRRDSFGAKLLALLRQRLDRLGVVTTMRLIDPTKPLAPGAAEGTFPVIWDLPAAVERCAIERRQALVLNDRPASGFAATHIDSVSVDDFTGGACAAQMLTTSRKAIVFAGPENDRRSQQRVMGFQSIRRANVIYAGGWFVEDGAAHADEVFKQRPDAVFCCNDRLAEALYESGLWKAGKLPAIVGFDDAPIAAKLNFNTIAIPWAELVGAAVRMISMRLAGDRSVAIRQVVAPQPIRRK